MSNVSTLLDAVKVMSEDQAAKALAVLGIAVNAAPFDQPDLYGAVQCRGIGPQHPEYHKRFITQSVMESLPEGPVKEFAKHWIWIANGRYEFGEFRFTAVRDEQDQIIPGIIAVPAVDNRHDWAPVLPSPQAVTDYVNAQPLPTTSNAFTGPR
jgi:hypothetical protein